jgi:hypothetical protein
VLRDVFLFFALNDFKNTNVSDTVPLHSHVSRVKRLPG